MIFDFYPRVKGNIVVGNAISTMRTITRKTAYQIQHSVPKRTHMLDYGRWHESTLAQITRIHAFKKTSSLELSNVIQSYQRLDANVKQLLQTDNNFGFLFRLV